MKKLKKITALLLVTVMCTAMTATAFAVQPFSDEDRWTTNARGELVYIVGDEVDDTPLKIEPQTASATGSTLLFEMILKEMYHDLHTTGAKSFKKASLKNSYVKATGTINNDVNDYVTVGLAYYDDHFYAPMWTLRDVDCGVSFSVDWEKRDLSSYNYYYGYAQSPYQSNTDPYSGTIRYYDGL